MKEMIILPGGNKIYRVISDYSLDESCNRYRAEVVYNGVTYTVYFYNNFWA